MQRISCRLFRNLLSVFCLVSAFSKGSDLIVKTDAACRVTVDGKFGRTLAPDKQFRLKLAGGEHHVEAVASADGAKWEKSVALNEVKKTEVVTISLGPALGFWLDPVTKRTWTAADNGSGLSRSQAQRYCRELTLAGFRDWTLASIDDLQRISIATANESGYRIKGAIRLSGWQWSATPGTQEGEGWAFDFGDGGRASVADGDSGLNRALCVRAH